MATSFVSPDAEHRLFAHQIDASWAEYPANGQVNSRPVIAAQTEQTWEMLSSSSVLLSAYIECLEYEQSQEAEETVATEGNHSWPDDPVIAAMKTVEHIEDDWGNDPENIPLLVLHEWHSAQTFIAQAKTDYAQQAERHDEEPPAWKIYETMQQANDSSSMGVEIEA